MTPLGSILGLDNDDVKTIGAAATTVGVLLALFGPSVRRWWRAPMLSIEYQPAHGEPFWDHVLLGDESFFLRLRVSNASGCDAAEDVQVITASYRSQSLGLDERPLEWSGQRTRDEQPVTSIGIPPGLSRHVDLLQISPDANPHSGAAAQATTVVSEIPLVARLCVHPKPWGRGHIVRPGVHAVAVVLASKNADAIRYTMTLRYDDELSASLLASPQRDRVSVAQRLRVMLKTLAW